MNYEGLIAIFFSAYLYWRINYSLISNPAMMEWVAKYKKMINIVAPLLFIFGVLQLFRYI